MSVDQNWWRATDGTFKLPGRYDGPELHIQPCVANEILLTVLQDGQHQWGYFNVLDVVEMVIEAGRIADQKGMERILHRAAIS